MTPSKNILGRRWALYGPVVFCVSLLVLGLWHFHGWAAPHLWDLLPGDRGDGRFIPFCLEHEYQSVLGHGHFTSPPFFYPAKGTLGYSDVLLGFLPLYSVFRLSGLDPFGSMQGTLWLGDILSFLLALGFLRRGIGFGLLSSAVGATFFAFNQPRFQETGHYQVQAGFLLPAAAWLIASALRDPRQDDEGWDLRWTWALLLVDLQLLTSYYLGWFAIFWGGLWLSVSALDPTLRPWLKGYIVRQRRNLSLAFFAFLVGLIPFFLIYLPALSGQGSRRYDDYLSLMPTWGSWFWMGPGHPIEGGLRGILGMDSNQVFEPELRMGFGLIVMSALGFAAFLYGWERLKGGAKGDRVDGMAPLFMATGLLGLMVLRWGPFSLWRWVFEYVPGGGSVRGVGRVAIFLALPLSVWLAWAFQQFVDGVRGKGIAQSRWWLSGAIVFALLAIVEQVGPPPNPGYSASAEIARLSRLAQGIPRDCEAFYIYLPPQAPGSTTDWSLDAAWVALLSGVPTLHGYSGTEPPGWDLNGLKRPDFKTRVTAWERLNHLKGPVCEIEPMGPSGGTGPGKIQ